MKKIILLLIILSIIMLSGCAEKKQYQPNTTITGILTDYDERTFTLDREILDGNYTYFYDDDKVTYKIMKTLEIGTKYNFNYYVKKSVDLKNIEREELIEIKEFDTNQTVWYRYE